MFIEKLPQKALGGVSKGIFYRKVRQQVAKIAKGNYPFIKTLPIYFCGRALQSPIASASGDASYKVEGSTFSVKLPFFSRIWARDRKIFTGVFSNLG